MQHRLLWFRDDLRVNDNAAVSAALHCDPTTQITTVFLTADDEWATFGYGANRLYYTEQLLKSLAHELAQRGIQFQVIRLSDYASQIRWITDYCRRERVTDLYFNQEYQWNERMRDHQIAAELNHVSIHSFVDRVILQPSTVLTGDDRYYSVFSPFKKRWLAVYQENNHAPYQLPESKRPKTTPVSWMSLVESPESDLTAFATNERQALDDLDAFIETKLTRYDASRNQPSIRGTSRLSAALARGLLSPRQCIKAAEDAMRRPISDFPESAFAWINELIWRDFYQHLLVGFPRLSKNKAFRPETEALQWRNNETEIEAWKNGLTGIPIVDAGMRELKATGWMHNRVRMIVAQFLTKNLLCDWRIGEAHFMRYLVDSDLGANNGGWQWSASTGTDAAPYFRVFNPVSQGETHDSEGDYICRYIPELSSLPKSKRHSPWLASVPHGYIGPIVDLKSSRQRAIDAFKDLKS
jgi:deoxyribodipyrimidine photo-lyase